MGKNTTNLFGLSFDAINAMKKKGLVSEIEKTKGKVVVGNNIKILVIKYLVYQKISLNSCSRIKNLVASCKKMLILCLKNVWQTLREKVSLFRVILVRIFQHSD